jgi:hypothetical protein
MPALVKRRVGSSLGTSELEPTRRWPKPSKYSRKVRLSSEDLIETPKRPPPVALARAAVFGPAAAFAAARGQKAFPQKQGKAFMAAGRPPGAP